MNTRCKSLSATDAEPPTVVFRLFDTLSLGACPPELRVAIDGVQYIRVVALDSSNNGTASEGAGPEGAV